MKDRAKELNRQLSGHAQDQFGPSARMSISKDDPNGAAADGVQTCILLFRMDVVAEIAFYAFAFFQAA